MAAMAMDQLPTDNEGWFKKHVIDALADLKVRQGDMMREQAIMHDTNISRIDGLSNSMRTHEAEDTARFAALSGAIAQMDPIRKVVYGLIGIILSSVVVALLGLIISKSK